MRHPAMLTGAVLAASLAVTGCTPTGPVPTPVSTPKPTFMCTPEAGGTEYACDQKAYDDMKAKDALYARAQQVYMQLFAERQRLYREGIQADKAALDLTEGVGTQRLEEAHSDAHHLSGEIKLHSMRRASDISRDGSVMALEACWDGSDTKILRGDPVGGTGSSWVERAFFKGDAQQMRISDAQSVKVETCG